MFVLSRWKVLGINGLISFEGESVRSLKEDFKSAINEYLEMCNENELEPEKAYIGEFNVRVSPELHKTLALYSASHGLSFNSAVEEAIKHFINK